MTLVRRIAATVVVASTLVVAAPTAALADVPTGAEYGQHVRDCAQTMGFTGEHNPGMHHGYAGWDGMTCDH
jgi:hypothetical protein